MCATICQTLVQTVTQPKIPASDHIPCFPNNIPCFPDPKKPTQPDLDCSNFHTQNKPPSDPPDLGSWDSIQSLTGSKESNSYTHPLAKRSSSTLSKKSLQLCTESLGCESGIDLSDSDCFSSRSRHFYSEKARERVRGNDGRKTGDFRPFPPALTSISGGGSVHARPHREDGRLVLKAATIPSTRNCLRAERSDGRLKLSFSTDGSKKPISFEDTKQGIGAVVETVGVGDLEKQEMGVSIMSNNISEDEDGQFELPNRCKEGGHGHVKIWEQPSPCCVTI